jgi:hypothetical protein
MLRLLRLLKAETHKHKHKHKHKKSLRKAVDASFWLLVKGDVLLTCWCGYYTSVII